MYWPTPWVVLLTAWACICGAYGMTAERQRELREEVRGLFKHGHDGYMRFGYPADELRSVTCKPLHRDPNVGNFGVNDVHPNASLTLLDTLSSLPIIYPSAFPDALHKVCTEISFDQDVKVQVFEMTIRALASLLSTWQYLDGLSPIRTAQQAHLFGTEKGAQALAVNLKTYMPRLLELALDLGKRFLPAFKTPTGLPYARVNLRHGVESGESIETCTAGAGSLLLEFAVLSRLTGDERFEALASRAYLALWNRRSTHNLLGNGIGVTHGHWLAPGMSSVGAGLDSYFEYGLKGAILLNDDMYLDIWQDTYAALQTHTRTADGFIYRPVQFRLLQTTDPSTVDSLSAFVSGMQVLAGDLESAIKSHLLFWNLWRRYDAMPESWDWQDRQLVWKGYPGRPEFIESTYYLYHATRDPFYLRVGERVLRDIRDRTKTACGFATMKDVETGELDDRMESFVLSESLKYLFLLFDGDRTHRHSNQVFTTEGHLLSMPAKHLRSTSSARRAMHRGENLQCPVYRPPTVGGGLVVGIERRNDYEYARSLVFGWGVNGRAIEDQDRVQWWEGGFCSVPSAPKFAFDVVLTPPNMPDQPVAPEDASPSLDKVRRIDNTGDFAITDTTGLRLGVRWRLDNRGYDVSSIGPHRVRPGQQVLVSDPQMEGYLPVPTRPTPAPYDPPEVLLRFATLSSSGERSIFLHAVGATATFGRPFTPSNGATSESGRPIFAVGGSGSLVLPRENRQGCSPFGKNGKAGGALTGRVVVLDRGGCTFLDKAVHAARAGAVGVLVVGLPPGAPDPDAEVAAMVNQKDATPDIPGALPAHQQEASQPVGLIRPSAEIDSEKVFHAVKDVAVLYVEHFVGEPIKRMLAVEQKFVIVEILRLDTGSSGAGETEGASPRHSHGSHASASGTAPAGNHAREEEIREGRVLVNDWPVCNLRIIEKTPDM